MTGITLARGLTVPCSPSASSPYLESHVGAFVGTVTGVPVVVALSVLS